MIRVSSVGILSRNGATELTGATSSAVLTIASVGIGMFTGPSEVVEEIKGFIAETGTPHLWRGHTHTKPPVGANVVHLAEFDLPKSHRSPDRYVPCPCCTPKHPKYFRDGKIGWFPGEHMIRMLDPDCSAHLNATGHAEALRQLRREIEKKAEIKYLLGNLDKVPALLSAVQAVLPVATAVDELRPIMTHAASLDRGGVPDCMDRKCRPR